MFGRVGNEHQGAAGKEGEDDMDHKYPEADHNEQWIEIPVLVRMNLASTGSLTPHLYAGPSVGFKLNYEEEPPPSDDEIQVNNTDYGLVFGGGLDVRKINLGVRYSLGLNEILEFEEERNNVIAIVAGINF